MALLGGVTPRPGPPRSGTHSWLTSTSGLTSAQNAREPFSTPRSQACYLPLPHRPITFPPDATARNSAVAHSLPGLGDEPQRPRRRGLVSRMGPGMPPSVHTPAVLSAAEGLLEIVKGRIDTARRRGIRGRCGYPCCDFVYRFRPSRIHHHFSDSGSSIRQGNQAGCRVHRLVSCAWPEDPVAFLSHPVDSRCIL